jgi:hypothetical protein
MNEREARAARELTEKHSSVPLRVDRVGEPGRATSTVYGTDIEGTELRVANGEPPESDRPLETGEWYQFDGVVRSGPVEAELTSPAGQGRVEPVDPPESQSQPPLSELDEPWLTQLGASERVIAVTVQPRPTAGMERIRADDPETFEIGAVCFAHCDGSGDRAVYHREEGDTEDEQLLLEHVVEDLSEAAGATLVTRGSGQPPLELLRTRLAAAAGGDVLDAGAERVLSACFHATLERVAHRAGAQTVEETARRLGIEESPVVLAEYDIGVEPAEWRADSGDGTDARPEVSDPQMSDRDYATLVEWYLGAGEQSVNSAQLAECLKAYVSCDLDLLAGVVADGAADGLGCPRLAGGLPKGA